MPGSSQLIVVVPDWRENASTVMRKNQPPAIDIIEFQTSPIMLAGSSSWLNFRQGERSSGTGAGGSGVDERRANSTAPATTASTNAKMTTSTSHEPCSSGLRSGFNFGAVGGGGAWPITSNLDVKDVSLPRLRGRA